VSEPVIRQLTASDGYVSNYRHWRAAAEKPLGYVVALHGIQSHSGWYEFSSERISQAGFQVDFLDRRGSGLNGQHRGDAPHEDRLINDVVQFTQQIRHQRNQIAPASPLILLAVSWGGKLAAVTVARRPELFDGLALLYPGLCSKVQATVLQRLKLKIAEKLGIRDPLAPIPLNDPALFTGEAKWQQFIRDDRLKIDDVTVSFLLANRGIDRLLSGIRSQFPCPVLCMLAGKDRIIDNEGTRRFVNRLAPTGQTVVEYSEARHTLEFEPIRAKIVDDVIDWLSMITQGEKPHSSSGA